MHPAVVFLLILTVNIFGVYWVAATPELLTAIGYIVDVYVFPGILAISMSIAAFWFYCKLLYIADRLRDERF